MGVFDELKEQQARHLQFDPKSSYNFFMAAHPYDGYCLSVGELVIKQKFLLL